MRGGDHAFDFTGDNNFCKVGEKRTQCPTVAYSWAKSNVNLRIDRQTDRQTDKQRDRERDRERERER